METTFEQLLEQPELWLSIAGQQVQPESVQLEGNRLTAAYPYGIVVEGKRTVYDRTVEWQWQIRTRAASPRRR